jgi:glutathione synthase/RimK-type ligase-like ATP-grasp enzyme
MKNCLVLSVKSGKSSYDLGAGAYQKAELGGTVEYKNASYDDLVVSIYENMFSIKIKIDKELVELSSFDMVYLLLVGNNLQLASLISVYAEHYNVVCLPGDVKYVRPEDKILQAAHFFVNNVNTIPTIFQRKYSFNIEELPFELPFVYKINFGTRGRDNHLITSEQQWREHEDNKDEFIVQKYIENNCDYRILCFGYEARLVIKRTAQSDKYLNNTSQGADAELVELDNIPGAVIDLAESAARVLKNEVAGVDVMQDVNDGTWYVVELNQSPQISTGTFSDEKLLAFTKFMESRITQ